MQKAIDIGFTEGRERLKQLKLINTMQLKHNST
jgi:hypothetical protein